MSAPRHTTAPGHLPEDTSPAETRPAETRPAETRPAETGSGGATVFDLERGAHALTDAAVRAGAAIMAHYGAPLEVEVKDDASPVTRADRDAEEILLSALERLAPDIPVVSEETATDRKAPLGRLFFLVDPLDGTKEFIARRTDFTVNVALIEDGFPCFGIVYAPARELLTVTVADGVALEAQVAPLEAGADLRRLSTVRLHAKHPDPAGLTALVSHSHLDEKTEDFLKDFNIANRAGAGSSVKFLEIARGNADVYPRFGPTMEWDTAAGQAVLEAAGGHVVDKNGARFPYGKTDKGLKNPSFVAWGRQILT